MDERPSPTVHGGRPRALAETPATYALAAICVAVLAWVEAHGSSTDTATLVRFGALERGRVWAGEPWRLLTAPFLHVGWFHLGWNVAAGVPWCRPVERALGSRRFVLVYLASAVGASALSLLGQDVPSAGASGALFGVVGATLALHRRALGSWRAFAASGPARRVIAAIVLFSVLGGLALPLDQLAHAGGLAVGAAIAWLLTRPSPARAWPWIAFSGALAAVVLAACWPRASMSRFEAEQVERSIAAALRSSDAAEARRLFARADAGRHDSDRLRLLRAYLKVQENDFEGALDLARKLRASGDARVRDDATKLAREVTRNLAYRHYTGDGAPRNPWRARAYLEEACALGDEPSCEATQSTPAR
ncbi:MAG TPA: rhomboid family intramembrane serine protease [Anaeromyxobacter sp.]|nr:rhomboid family intramembrane serine protease [Anaeromyxobacter sp.]